MHILPYYGILCLFFLQKEILQKGGDDMNSTELILVLVDKLIDEIKKNNNCNNSNTNNKQKKTYNT